MKRGTFTIGTTTTRVTGPVDAEGYIDYGTALNERLGKGGTPENNAVALIWNALGPYPTGRSIPPNFFERMGISVPPPGEDDYLAIVHCFKQRPASFFLKLLSRLKALFRPQAGEAEVALAALYGFCWRSWKTNDNPPLAAWLERNEKPLARIAEATTRSHYHWPIVRETRRETAGMLLLPEVHILHEVGKAFAMRAMFHLGDGNAGAAWRDLLTCHQLARLVVAHGGTLMEGVVGMAIELTACRADTEFLSCSKPDARTIDICMRDLRALPPFPNLADKIDLGERFWALDTLMQIDRVGISLLSQLWDLETGQFAAHGFSDNSLKGIDWDPGLEALNTWYDRMVAALQEGDRNTRNHELAQIESQVLKLRSQFDGELWAALKNSDTSPALRGHVVAYWALSHTLTSFQKVRVAGDRTAQCYENTIVAFALARYHLDNGEYPDSLEMLVPNYLKEVPLDIFSGNVLLYRRTPGGYLLYSVGPSGRDYGGHTQNDHPDCDDIVVRMPSR